MIIRESNELGAVTSSDATAEEAEAEVGLFSMN
jgi:hypothetical protein